MEFDKWRLMWHTGYTNFREGETEVALSERLFDKLEKKSLK